MKHSRIQALFTPLVILSLLLSSQSSAVSALSTSSTSTSSSTGGAIDTHNTISGSCCLPSEAADWKRNQCNSKHQHTTSRRSVLQNAFFYSTATAATITGASLLRPWPASANEPNIQVLAGPSLTSSSNLQNFEYSSNWKGTALPLLSFTEAAQISQPSYDMGRWPDPILRRPASPVPISCWIKNKNKEMKRNANDNHIDIDIDIDIDNDTSITINDDNNDGMNKFSIRDIANKLRRTARENGAVGLAAQQCGIDVSMIFLDESKYINSQQQQQIHLDKGGLFLVNPRIIARSPEMEMKVWKEQCLVLPPSFIATVLRDAHVQVQYEDLNDGETKNISLKGEMARALQHELDHDRGILIVDHVGLEELEAESQIMRRIEEDGHDQRQLLAYNRFIDESRSRNGNRNRNRNSQDFNGDGDGDGDGDNGVNLNSEASNSQSLFSRAKEAAVPPANAANDDTGTEAALGGNNKAMSTNVKVPPAPSQSDGTTNDDASTSMSMNTITCDDECRDKRRIVIQERRAMMNQSRSTGRSEVFELSKQRAKLYGTEYRGVSCPPGVPCI